VWLGAEVMGAPDEMRKTRKEVHVANTGKARIINCILRDKQKRRELLMKTICSLKIMA
jgi:hypothetical protein